MSHSDLAISHFGLSTRPFKVQPDPEFLFWSRQHMRAYAVLEYGLMTRAPITLLTGEIGAGKTTLLNKLIADQEGQVTFGLVSNTAIERREILPWVLNSLGQKFPQDAPYVTLFQHLQDFVLSKYAAGLRVVIVFDEAQNLTRDGLEELRMLTNINSGSDELLQLVLVGQPELRDMVMDKTLRQFAQRVSASFHLGRMDEDTVLEYMQHRLRKAGGHGGEFLTDACALIYVATDGIPRLVNQLAELSMVYAYANNQHEVTAETVQHVLDDGIFLGGQMWDQETAH